MPKRDLVGLDGLSSDDVCHLLELSRDIKKSPQNYAQALAGKSLAMLFQKPSTRTRVSFQVGMSQLGGQALVLNSSEIQIDRGESISDTAKVLSRYVDAIMARVFAHSTVEGLAEHATVPVINGLSDLLHPCQALADFLTMSERFESLNGLKVTYVGDGNNVAHSLCVAAAKLGTHLTLACPEGYRPDESILKKAQAEASQTGAQIAVIEDPDAAVAGAQVIYTDTWTSMGQEAENAKRTKDLARYQVNAQLFSKAAPDAAFLHCLPAHRGEEVTDEIADHERSAIFDQAENRLHTQKAVLLWAVGAA